MGVALDIHNRVTVRRISDGAAQSLDELPANAAALFFSKTELPKFPFVWEISGNVPRSRGLGSSVTVRLGLLAGLNELAGAPCTRETLFGMCAELEGHPDNAAPATFGGFTVAGGKQVARFSVSPELHFVLLIPDCEISTPEARRVLPATIDRLGAARSCANACRITAAFASQNYALLEGAFEDHLHQPYRQKTLIPFLNEVIRAGKDAGALGGFLSGSGSTICCVTLNKVEEVGRAMLSAAPAGSRVVAAVADNEGANQIV